MTPASTRLVGNLMLGIGILLLPVTLAGMLGLTAKLAPSRELVPVCAILVLAGGALRRRGRGAAT